MRRNGLLKSLLKAAVYIMDQTAEQVDRASDRASQIADRAKSAIYPEEDHTLRNILSFAAGVGVGVGAGLLFAPASGAEIRSSIGDRVHDISDKVKERMSTKKSATGTE
jgi:gas vesicle protein